MSQESARVFIETAQQNRAFRMAVQEYLLSRDVHKLVNFGQERGFEFTAQEIKWAIDTYWDIHAVADEPSTKALVDGVETLEPTAYYFHPFNRGFVQGEHQVPFLSQGGYSLWWGIEIAVFLGIFSILVAVGVRNEILEGMAFQENSIRVDGWVVGHRIEAVPLRKYDRYRTYDQYYVTYRFPFPSVRYVQEQKVDEELFRSLEQHEHVWVVYDPADPSSARLELTLESRADYEVYLVIVFVLVAAFVVSSLAVVFHHHSYKRYGERGTVVNGKVTDFERHYGVWRRENKTIIQISSVNPHTQEPITKTMVFPIRRFRNDKKLPTLPTVVILFVDEWHWWVL